VSYGSRLQQTDLAQQQTVAELQVENARFKGQLEVS